MLGVGVECWLILSNFLKCLGVWFRVFGVGRCVWCLVMKVGCLVLGVGCWVLVVVCWVLGVFLSFPSSSVASCLVLVFGVG